MQGHEPEPKPRNRNRDSNVERPWRGIECSETSDSTDRLTKPYQWRDPFEGMESEAKKDPTEEAGGWLVFD
jgi:hypothetical protein